MSPSFMKKTMVYLGLLDDEYDEYDGWTTATSAVEALSETASATGPASAAGESGAAVTPSVPASGAALSIEASALSVVKSPSRFEHAERPTKAVIAIERRNVVPKCAPTWPWGERREDNRTLPRPINPLHDPIDSFLQRRFGSKQTHDDVSFAIEIEEVPRVHVDTVP